MKGPAREDGRHGRGRRSFDVPRLFWGDTTGQDRHGPKVGFLNDFALGPIKTEMAHKPVYVDCSDKSV